MPNCERCGSHFPNRVKIDGVVKHIGGRKYCLDCSPAGTHNTRKLTAMDVTGKPKTCSRCGESDHTKFYGKKRWYCAKCHLEYTNKRGRDNKAYAREKLGGKCVLCGFDKYHVSLDIHHLDPSRKDTFFKAMRGWSRERIEREIEGCVLLCKNCHQALHAGLVELNRDMA